MIPRGLSAAWRWRWLGAGLERAADRAGIQFDWTFEQSFELSGHREGARGDRRHARRTLYHDASTRACAARGSCSRAMRADGGLVVRRAGLDDHPDEEDRYGVGTSNSVVFRLGDAARPSNAPPRAPSTRPSTACTPTARDALRCAARARATPNAATRSATRGSPGAATEGYALQISVAAALRECRTTRTRCSYRPGAPAAPGRSTRCAATSRAAAARGAARAREERPGGASRRVRHPLSQRAARRPRLGSRGRGGAGREPVASTTAPAIRHGARLATA